MVDLLKTGDLNSLREFLAREESTIFELSDRGRPLLALAVLFGSEELVGELLRSGVDPDLGRGAVVHAAGSSSAMLRLLLDAGADPTLHPPGSWSAIQAARGQRREENVRLLRKYAKPFLATKRGTSFLAKRSKRMTVGPSIDRHAKHLRNLFVDEPRWEILVTRANVERTLAAFGDVALDTHPNAHKVLVPEEKSQLFVLRFKSMPWTVCIRRLGYYGSDGRAWLRETAGALSESLGETLAFWGLQMFRYDDGELVSELTWSIDDVDDERLDEDEDLVEATRGKLFAEMDAWLREKDLLLPAMEDVSDGYCRKLAVMGIMKSDVEQMAIVDLEQYD